MLIDDFRSQLELELRWRQEELAFFKNLLNDIKEKEKDKYRKCLVLILYAHMEGYIKFSLQLLVQYINELKLSRNEVTIDLRVSSMHKDLLLYENDTKPLKLLGKTFPEDKRLNRLYKQKFLVQNIETFKNDLLSIDDSVIDTESNLWYVVLVKNLYKLGLPIDLFEEYQKDIDGLVNRRNSIAHGNMISGVTKKEFYKWENSVLKMLSDITKIIYEYLKKNKYMKSN